MVKLINPLFSVSARKQLGHNVIYKQIGKKSILTKYNRPGGVNPFTPSAAQTTMREHYFAAIGAWRSLTPTQKQLWRDFIK